jgi:hypothetical protein
MKEIRNLLTKFFYKNNHLHFQILVQKENSLEIFGEYDDYNQYKNAFDTLHLNISTSDTQKRFEKIGNSEIFLANVA